MFLVEAQPLFRRHCLLSRQRVVMINVAQRLQHITAFFRKVVRHFHNLPPSMREAVCLQKVRRLPTFGELRDNASLIWIGAGSPRARCFSTSARFSPACFQSGKEQCDGPCADHRYDTAGERPRPLVARFACQAQNPHAGIVVVHPRRPAPPVGSTPPAPAKAVSRRQPSGPTASSPAAASPRCSCKSLPTD